MQDAGRGESPGAYVDAIWDGTPEHAEALRRLLAVSNELWRGGEKEPG
jgi:hypothetical protein